MHSDILEDSLRLKENGSAIERFDPESVNEENPFSNLKQKDVIDNKNLGTDSNSNEDYSVTRTAYSSETDRIPPPKLISIQGASTNIPNIVPSETTSLIYTDTQHQYRGDIPKYKPSAKNLYLAYDNDDNEDNSIIYGGRKRVKMTSLVAFWASFVGMALSLPMLVYGIFCLVTEKLTSADVLSCTLAIVLGLISLSVETVHSCAPCFPRCIPWKLGRHTMLHCLISLLGLIPMVQGKRVMAVLFILHIIPAGLFYTARIRREHRTKPLSSSDSYYP